MRRSCRGRVVAEKRHSERHVFLADKMVRMYQALVESRRVLYRLDRMAHTRRRKRPVTARVNSTFEWPQSSRSQIHFTRTSCFCSQPKFRFYFSSNHLNRQRTFELDCNKINTALEIHVSEHNSPYAIPILETLSVRTSHIWSAAV